MCFHSTANSRVSELQGREEPKLDPQEVCPCQRTDPVGFIPGLRGQRGCGNGNGEGGCGQTMPRFECGRRGKGSAMWRRHRGEALLGGSRHILSSVGLAESPGPAQRRMRFPSAGLGQLRPCAEAGREWPGATVPSSPRGGGCGLESALPCSVLLQNTLLTGQAPG